MMLSRPEKLELGRVQTLSFDNSHVTFVNGNQITCGLIVDDGETPLDPTIISDWLSALDFSTTQNEIFQGRVEGTGQWLLESQTFKEWHDGPRETLFCPGMPGAGKTFIVSIVINHIRMLFKENADVATAFIYLDHQKQTEQTIPALISSLLKQLILSHSMNLDDVKLLYENHKNQKTRPTLRELVETLDRGISRYSKVFVIVDALDELEAGERVKFLKELQSLTGPVYLMLEIRAHDGDVRNFVKHLMSDQYSTGSKEIVFAMDQIVEKAEGMFRIAQLYVDLMKGQHSPAKITQLINTRPVEMYEMYDEAMKRIERQNERDRALAHRILCWITFTCRPLSMQELNYALAVVPGMTRLDHRELIYEECLTAYCAGLVVVDEESRTIGFVHHTAWDYFESQQERLFPDAQAYITRTCLTYLLYEDFGKVVIHDLQAFPFLDYAVRYWGFHAHGGVEETEKALLLQFLQNSQRLVLTFQILERERFVEDLPTAVRAVQLCIHFGLDNTVEYLLEAGFGEGVHRAVTFLWAAENGHDSVVKLLLARGNIDIKLKDQHGRTALSRAAGGGHESITGLLLTKGFDPRTKDNHGRTPLSWAAAEGHKSVVSALLEHKHGADVKSKDKDGWTPLTWASARGHESVVELLLAQNGVDVNAKDGRGRTPLSLAAEKGFESVVKQLLGQRKIDVNSKDEQLWTALSWAAAGGHESVVKLLLTQRKVVVNLKDKHGRTPTWWAAENGHDSMVKLLIEH